CSPFPTGDGTPAVPPTPSTPLFRSTYAVAGTYTVTLIVTDTGGQASSPATATVTVTAADNPPIARLTVTQVSSPALTVNADGSGTCSTHVCTPATNRFRIADATSTD